MKLGGQEAKAARTLMYSYACSLSVANDPSAQRKPGTVLLRRMEAMKVKRNERWERKRKGR